MTVKSLRLNLSVSYRGVRCLICIAVRDDAQLSHANLTHAACRSRAIAVHLLGLADR
jgi:hypothetical protein